MQNRWQQRQQCRTAVTGTASNLVILGTFVVTFSLGAKTLPPTLCTSSYNLLYNGNTNIKYHNINIIKGTGAYGPLLLAPAESLGGPLSSGGYLMFSLLSLGKSIDILTDIWFSQNLTLGTQKLHLGQLNTMTKLRFFNWLLVNPIRPPSWSKM